MIHKIKLNSDVSINFKPKDNVSSLDAGITTEKVVTIKELSTLVTQPYAYIWTPHFFEGKRRKETWQSQSVFYLDFDNKNKVVSLQDILNQLSLMSIRPNIIYNTLSDTPQLRKYRVVIFIDSVIRCSETALWIQSNLVKMFPDSDPSCSTIERMVYPGFSVIHLDQIENSTIDIMNIINSFLVSTDTHGRTRKMKAIDYTVDDNGNDQYKIIFDKSLVKDFNIEAPKIIDDFNWKLAFKDIKILNDFNNGIRLPHLTIFGIATNLYYIKGGMKYMKEKMIEVNNNPNRLSIDGFPADKYVSNQFAILSQMRSNKYMPSNLKFSPYIEDQEYKSNLLDAVKFKRGRIDILKDIEKITLSQAERKLAREFKRVYKDIYTKSPISYEGDIFTDDTSPNFEKKIFLFKVATGLGKTKILENIENTLISFPTNYLKKQVSDRMSITHSVTPDYPKFSIDEINESISNYHGSGLYELSSAIVESISIGNIVKISNKTYTPTKDDVDIAREFREENLLCRTVTHTVLTTHTRAIFDRSFKHDTIIFDECPLHEIITIGNCSLDFSILDGTEWKGVFEDFYRNTVGYNYIQDNKTFVINNFSGLAEFCAVNKRSDIIKLLKSKVVFKDKMVPGIQFATQKPLPNKNIIIMSATAPEAIYRKMFGNSLEIIEIDNIEKVGSVKQYTTKSWSRSSFNNSSLSSKKELYDLIGDRKVITFKGIKKFFKNASIMHYGACSGSDELKGLDIAVVGTDNKPTYFYFFYAYLLGIKLNTNDNLLSSQIIEWNDFRFRIMTFDNPELRDIQLSIIESETIQGVGRGRTLRENCETLLFSSLPLKISDKFIF